VHFRNVRGKVPKYHEVFIDEGDLDVFRVLRILHRNDYQGVITPDHTPLMSCDAPWHAGMAHALGYLRAAIDAVRAETATEYD
jgi:mannonate dehydratase